MRSSASFQTILSESQLYAKPLGSSAEPKTDFNAKYHSGSFKVIYFDVTENPLSDYRYILQYGVVALYVTVWTIYIVSERSENLHFRPPRSHLTPPLQQTPANIIIVLILLETRISGLHFAADSMGLSSFKF